METYPSTIEIGGVERKVDILKVGRIALVYQTPDGAETGMYNPTARQYEAVDNSYQASVDRGYSYGSSAGINRYAEFAGSWSRSSTMISEMTHGLNKLKFVATASLALGAAFFAPLSIAEEGAAPATDLVVNEANSLDELLKNVQERRVVESRENTARERRFANEKAEQARLLKEAEAERLREQRRSDRLETQFEENEIRIGDLTEQLDKRLGSLRELFGVLQQVAGDTRGGFEGSIISSQYANRGDWLGELAKKMGTSSQLATIDEMESLWFELQREMTESGKISKYPGTITKLSGDKVNTEIVRVGSFALIGEGQYLQWDVTASRFQNWLDSQRDATYRLRRSFRLLRLAKWLSFL